ncbi:MAG: hypothetical protein AMXMBFR61_24390 [Fimbriimonadales bacterium]
MFSQGDIVTYLEMCQREGRNLQRGMNFRTHADHSVILMSQRPNAPYRDRIEDDGRTLIYEGHDAPRTQGGPDPKTLDQPLTTSAGQPTQNGHFWKAAHLHKCGQSPPHRVHVYEKLRPGIWVFNGVFDLRDAWLEEDDRRVVCRFRLTLREPEPELGQASRASDLDHTRLIPSHVKQEVWKRDGGRCRICGATDNLHFDHIIPYSRGGSSLVGENIQLLCARHNLAKRDRIE